MTNLLPIGMRRPGSSGRRLCARSRKARPPLDSDREQRPAADLQVEPAVRSALRNVDRLLTRLRHRPASYVAVAKLISPSWLTPWAAQCQRPRYATAYKQARSSRPA